MGYGPDSLPAILVMGGARGDQDYGTVLRALDARGVRAQAVVLCGWNEKLKTDGIFHGVVTLMYVRFTDRNSRASAVLLDLGNGGYGK